MEWIERLNSAIYYMEEHIREELDMEEVARIACCSTYHFQRMFAYMADVPLSEYVRRRRMSLAAVDLQSGDCKVIDASLKYGYDSPTAFNRAFKNVHGIAPSQAKEDGIVLKAFPPISFRITIKGDSEMNFRIEKKDAFHIVGMSSCKRQVFSSKKRHLFSGIFRQIKSSTFAYIIPRITPRVCFVYWKGSSSPSAKIRGSRP